MANEDIPSGEIRRAKSNGERKTGKGGYRRWVFGLKRKKKKRTKNQEECKGSGSVGDGVGEVIELRRREEEGEVFKGEKGRKENE